MTAADSRAGPERPAYERDGLWAALAVLGVLGAIKYVGVAKPSLGSYAATAAIAFQLYVPLYLIGLRGVTRESLGLTVAPWRLDLSVLVVVSALTLIPYAIAVHVYMTIFEGRVFVAGWPTAGFFDLVVTHLILVAPAEEIYFRGFLQERLGRRWPPRCRWWGAPVGRAWWATAVVFALAHFIGEFHVPARLATFFPGLVFGWMRARTGSVLSAIAYHAFCNVLAAWLINSYQFRSF